MALKQPLAIKTVLGSATPTLKADPGEAFLVKDILVRDSSASYITVSIEKSTVGYFRTKGPYGSHLAFRRGHAQHSHTIRINDGSGVVVDHHAPLRDGANVDRNLMLASKVAPTGDVYDEKEALLTSGFKRNPTILDFLTKAGVFKGFPIAEGETMTISGMGSANSITLILYEIYEPGDISADQPNGSRSKEYTFLNYGNTGASITSPGDALYDTPQTPAEFPAFPFGKVVPAKHEIDIIGILGSPRAPGTNDGTNYIYTEYLKLIKDRETLFDEDKNGILFLQRSPNVESNIDVTAEGFTLIGNYSEYDNNPPLLFPTPITFVPGDELNIYLTTVGAGTYGTLDTSEQEIALIETVRRLD